MRTYLLLLLSLIVGSAAVNASDMPPTPRITLDSPARSELIGYTGETLTFSSSTSSANCGTINQRRWRLDSGSYVYATNFTHTFTLPAGVYEKTYTLELRTRNTCNLYKTETKTITIRRDKRVYFVKDHLGSVRATVNEAGDVISHDDYYPFGLTMPGRSANTANPNDNYKFTGHERDDEAGLTIDYMGARNYDPILGRFLQIDPLADQFPAWNPYHYVHNNPLNLTDPTGMAACPPVCGPIMFSPKIGLRLLKMGGALLTSAANSVSTPLGKDGAEIMAQQEAAMMEDAFGSEGAGRAVQAGMGIVFALKGNPKNLIDDVGDFASGALRKSHFEKHADEFGDLYKSADDYLKGAQDFFKSKGEGIMQYARKNGDVVQYDSKKNLFGVVDKDGAIRTFFKPENGADYMKDQIRKDLGEEVLKEIDF